MQDYIDQKLAKPMGWGPWGYAHIIAAATLAAYAGRRRHRGAFHRCAALRVPAAASAAVGERQQLVPAEYVAMCGRPSPYQKHAPFSLMFEVNADHHVAGAPARRVFQVGRRRVRHHVIPSLDMVIYKMAGSDSQYDPALTGIPQNYKYDGSRDNWKPAAKSQFSDGPIGTDDGVRRVLEMVAAAVVE